MLYHVIFILFAVIRSFQLVFLTLKVFDQSEQCLLCTSFSTFQKPKKSARSVVLSRHTRHDRSDLVLMTCVLRMAANALFDWRVGRTVGTQQCVTPTTFVFCDIFDFRTHAATHVLLHSLLIHAPPPSHFSRCPARPIVRPPPPLASRATPRPRFELHTGTRPRYLFLC